MKMTRKTPPESSSNTLKLTDNSLAVLKARYLSKNEKGEISETPEALIHRVASAHCLAVATGGPVGAFPAGSVNPWIRK